MKRYKIHTGEDSKGLLKISFVAEPAIQSKLMYFTEEKRNFVFADEERRVIYAPALIPDLDIYRKNVNGEPANVFFDKETILKLHLDGCRNGYDSKINLNHSESEDIDGVYCFESWIVGEDNRAEKFGFEVPEGTLMKGYKVDNEELWQDIKAGKVTGLSIEAALMPIEEEPINKFNMNKKGIMALAIEEMKKLFKFADATDYGGGFFGSSLEIGSIITDKDGNPMPSTSFTFEGKVYETDEMGGISGVEDVKEEEKEVELEDESASKITALETEIADLKAQLAAKEEMKMADETEVSTLKLSNENQASEILKLKEDVIAAKKVQSVNVPEKKYEEMTNAEKVKYNRQK